ncbi:MAG: hypothetical protein K6T83_01230 [Alicyclobacillus sp.]|nr:hypothetical protein [Alicyclobacillus sp.]
MLGKKASILAASFLMISSVAFVNTTAVAANSTSNNLWPYEDPTTGYFHALNATVSAKDSIKWHGITLYKLQTTGGFYSFIHGVASRMSQSFQPGAEYLASAYITTRSSHGFFFWKNYMANGVVEGAGASYADGTIRQYFWTFKATGPHSPDPYWFFSASTAPRTVWIGGFKIQKISPNTRNGVAVIGDSTTAGGSGFRDLINSEEWTRWAEGLLSVPFYNRAKGGERTDQMDARWNRDITPLAKICKYVIIQGGINDIGQGRPLADIEASIKDMYNKAIRDHMTPIIATCTPLSVDRAAIPGREQERQELNAWEKKTFPLVLDFASVVQDPSNPTLINPAPGWAPSDGSPHYGPAAKEAIGKYVASWPHWNFVTPSNLR